MKYLKEIAIIFGITMIGELLNQWIPFRCPQEFTACSSFLGFYAPGR